MMTTTYRVRGWGSVFENSQSRRYKQLSWVPVPNKHDGKSYRRLIALPNGPALYGAWMLILQVASKCPIRGTLADADGALSADDLSAKTGSPSDLLSEAFSVLTDPKIGWLEVDSVDDAMSTLGARSEHTPSTLGAQTTNSALNRTEQNRNELNRIEETNTGDAADADPDVSVKPKRVKAVFVKPTIDEVAAYCRERGNGIDAEHFVDHYQARGWKLKGGDKMSDWKAAVRTWEKNADTFKVTGKPTETGTAEWLHQEAEGKGKTNDLLDFN